MDVLLIVDMQQGLLSGSPKHELDSVVARIDRVAKRIRAQNGRVIFIRHTGPTGDEFARDAAGWQFLPGIQRESRDPIVEKTLNDAFFATTLDAELRALEPSRVFIAGWATDFCVDATVRSAVARGHRVVVVADAHTVSDRPHLRATEVIAHHHFVWTNLIAPQALTLMSAAEI